MYIKNFVSFVRETFSTSEFIPLHAPQIGEREIEYTRRVVESGFVSSVGEQVSEFETLLCSITGVRHAVAMVNGTAALHIGLLAVGVDSDCEVITQALSFVATANAIKYTGASPIFVDVDENSLGLSHDSLACWLHANVSVINGDAINRSSGKRIGACIPMHTFGFIGDIESIRDLCDEYCIPLVEDAAEALGSMRGGIQPGHFGLCAAVSFNGNKIITTGGGGALLTNSDELAQVARHLSTTAKRPHKWQYFHDQVGYNYRMPNLNAGLGLAQLEQLGSFIAAKRKLAEHYSDFFSSSEYNFMSEPNGCESNYWLNAIECRNSTERDEFLTYTNSVGIMTRPVWDLINTLPAFIEAQSDGLYVSRKLAERLVNIPSSVILHLLP